MIPAANFEYTYSGHIAYCATVLARTAHGAACVAYVGDELKYIGNVAWLYMRTCVHERGRTLCTLHARSTRADPINRDLDAVQCQAHSTRIQSA